MCHLSFFRKAGRNPCIKCYICASLLVLSTNKVGLLGRAHSNLLKRSPVWGSIKNHAFRSTIYAVCQSYWQMLTKIRPNKSCCTHWNKHSSYKTVCTANVKGNRLNKIKDGFIRFIFWSRKIFFIQWTGEWFHQRKVQKSGLKRQTFMTEEKGL